MEKLTDRIFVRVEKDEDPFLVASTSLKGIGESLEDGDRVEVAEYKLVRKFKAERGTVEIR